MKIKIISPSDRINKTTRKMVGIKAWQDYWVKLELEKELTKRGHVLINDFDVIPDIDICLAGGWWTTIKWFKAPRKFMWFFSHPAQTNHVAYPGFIKQFEHVWIASFLYLPQFQQRFPGIKCSVAIGATAKSFVPRQSEPQYDIAFMGNCSKHPRVELMKHLIALKKYKIRIAGNWGKKEFVIRNKKTVTCQNYFPNEEYPSFYNSGKITFFSGHQDMRQWGFIPPRHYDVYASSECLMIAETNPGLKDIFRNIPTFETEKDLVDKIDYYLSRPREAKNISEQCRKNVLTFTYSHIVDQMEKEF